MIHTITLVKAFKLVTVIKPRLMARFIPQQVIWALKRVFHPPLKNPNNADDLNNTPLSTRYLPLCSSLVQRLSHCLPNDTSSSSLWVSEVSAYNQQQKYCIKNHATKEMWIFTVLDLTELLQLSF